MPWLGWSNELSLKNSRESGENPCAYHQQRAVSTSSQQRIRCLLRLSFRFGFCEGHFSCESLFAARSAISIRSRPSPLFFAQAPSEGAILGAGASRISLRYFAGSTLKSTSVENSIARLIQVRSFFGGRLL